MIKRNELKEMLDRRLPHNWCAQDWRKDANGRLVRYVDWRKPSAR